jgi:hypothetical protein
MYKDPVNPITALLYSREVVLVDQVSLSEHPHAVIGSVVRHPLTWAVVAFASSYSPKNC